MYCYLEWVVRHFILFIHFYNCRKPNNRILYNFHLQLHSKQSIIYCYSFYYLLLLLLWPASWALDLYNLFYTSPTFFWHIFQHFSVNPYSHVAYKNKHYLHYPLLANDLLVLSCPFYIRVHVAAHVWQSVGNHRHLLVSGPDNRFPVPLLFEPTSK